MLLTVTLCRDMMLLKITNKEVKHVTINATKIELLRAEQNLTNSALAERCGISRQSISAIVRRGSCNPLTAAKLARGLGVPTESIIKED